MLQPMEGTGPVEREPEELCDSGPQQDSLEEFHEGPKMMVC